MFNVRKLALGGVTGLCTLAGYNLFLSSRKDSPDVTQTTPDSPAVTQTTPDSPAVTQTTADSPAVTQTTPAPRPTPQDLRLLNVQIFFRHGARTPLKFFENIEEVRTFISNHIYILPSVNMGSLDIFISRTITPT